MTPAERAAAFLAAVGGQTITFSLLGVNFAISEILVMGGTVWFTPSAWTGSGAKRVYLPIDPVRDPVSGRAYGIGNPPLGVPTGLFDAEGRPTFTRDDIAAAKRTVYDIVTGYARKRGWAG